MGINITTAEALAILGQANTWTVGQVFSAAINLTSGQITFPASQSASADANTLDDYEEGSWTPTIIGYTTAGTQTYSIQVGRYVKVGSLVVATFYVAITAKDAAMAGNAAVGGLPFVTHTVTNIYYSAGVSEYGNIDLSAGKSQLGMAVTNGNTSMIMSESGDNVASATLQVAALATTAYVLGTVSYRTT